MGATTFIQTESGKTAREAFENAREQAGYDHGHAGYTGTIAEKNDFTMFKVPEGKDADDYADELIDDDKLGKWGPAGCIDLGDDEYMFFGWASE
jgi:hypothetical protein